MSQADALDADARKRVEEFVTDWQSDHDVPGASVAFADGDEVAYAEGFGARDLASDAPATPDTLYGVASVSKSFTATAVMQLVERGDVAVDDPVSDYLPHLESVPGEQPTVEELLTHTSGMPSDGALVALISRFIGEGAVPVALTSEDDHRRYVEQSAGEHAEGERFFYYNTGYTLLGKLVERVDGREFPAYVDDEILAPLGMERSVMAGDPVDCEDAMTPYWLGEDDTDVEERSFPVTPPGAAGGLLSSARELATYLGFAMRVDDAAFEDVLPAARRKQMQRAYATRDVAIDGTEETYGYGWRQRPFLGDEVVEHGGALAVSTSYIGFLEDAQFGVAVACNASPEVHPTAVGRGLLAIARGEKPEAVVPTLGIRAATRAVAGEYESYRGVQTATVEPADGGIEVALETPLSEESLTAFPESSAPDERAFYTVGADGNRVPLTFERDEDSGRSLYYRRWRLRSQDGD